MHKRLIWARLICMARGHQWKPSVFQPLNLNFRAGEYSAVCERCTKYETKRG